MSLLSNGQTMSLEIAPFICHLFAHGPRSIVSTLMDCNAIIVDDEVMEFSASIATHSVLGVFSRRKFPYNLDTTQ